MWIERGVYTKTVKEAFDVAFEEETDITNFVDSYYSVVPKEVEDKYVALLSCLNDLYASSNSLESHKRTLDDSIDRARNINAAHAKDISEARDLKAKLVREMISILQTGDDFDSVQERLDKAKEVKSFLSKKQQSIDTLSIIKSISADQESIKEGIFTLCNDLASINDSSDRGIGLDSISVTSMDLSRFESNCEVSNDKMKKNFVNGLQIFIELRKKIFQRAQELSYDLLTQYNSRSEKGIVISDELKFCILTSQSMLDGFLDLLRYYSYGSSESSFKMVEHSERLMRGYLKALSGENIDYDTMANYDAHPYMIEDVDLLASFIPDDDTKNVR